ncbi:MAG: glycosyltransferase family 4 protein, partial [Bdellovibrionales bacterium]|nr:glycosyltransferase family 4 protein [Bdellovibrionales bacterium]
IVAMYRPSTIRRGGERLIDFFRLIFDRVPEAQIVVFGEDGDFPYDLAPRVQRIGKISRKRVAEIYRASAFCVDLSHFHGFGRMGIESMSCGCVPLMTESGGVSEYMVSGLNSIRVDPTNYDTAVDSLVELLESKEQFEKYRMNALKTSEKWSEWRASEDWLNLLEIQSSPSKWHAIEEIFHQNERSELSRVAGNV